jgi:hypothetical protein
LYDGPQRFFLLAKSRFYNLHPHIILSSWIQSHYIFFISPTPVPQTTVSRTAAASSPSSSSSLFMADKPPVERGVSMDQDGKSNVWAIEPKMEIESKSSEEKAGGLLLAIGGIGIAAVIAGAVLTNLPDPNQF